MVQLSIESVQTEISQAIGKKFGHKGQNLKFMIAKERRKLPRGFEKDLEYLFEAEKRTKHPKRRWQVDLRKLEAIRRSCLMQLDDVDIKRTRTRARYLWLAEFAARVLMFTAALVGGLYWFNLI